MKGKPIKVAFIVGGLPFGGVENWLLDLVLPLKAESEIDPYVINLSGTGNLMSKYEKMGVEVLCIGSDKKSIKTHRLDTLLELRKRLKEIQPDVVHTMHFSADYFGRLASLGLDVPVFCHVHNVKSERKTYRRLANKALSYATTCYFSVSKEVASTVKKDHNIAERPSRVLYNAVDPAKLDVEPFDLSERHGLSGKTIVGVGRFVAQKNFDKLIKAFAIVSEQDPDASLLLLGDGGQMDDLKQLVQELQLDDKVCLPGYVNNADIPSYLKAAYVLAMPSEYEGLPITHVESLFCGLPAVVSEHVPSIEIAADASLVCTTDVDDIAEKLVRVLSDTSLHSSLSQAALSIAPEYTIERYIELLMAAYREFL